MVARSLRRGPSVSKGPGCPVCGASAAPPFLERFGVPAHQNLLVDDEASAVATPRGDLRLAVCEACGFAWNLAFDPARLAYGAAYDNTQACSPAFDAYMTGLARHMVEERAVTGRRIVEVGCGKGLFLRRLVEMDPGNTAVGFDTAYVGSDSLLDGRIRFERRFYGPGCAGVPADVVVCRHVIEHVPDPVGLLRSVRQALSGSPQARVFFETPCLDWILQREVVWDLFFEHCSYFTAASLSTAFQRAGFRVEEVRHVFGGQYLFLEATPLGKETAPGIAVDPGETPELARAFTMAEAERLTGWTSLVRDRAKAGKVAIWGAGAKGVTFANLIDPSREFLDCVVDLNPNKQGRFLPGTGHPIVGFESLSARGVRAALLMNPNYRAENEALLRGAGLDVELVDLMGAEPEGSRGEKR